MFVARLFSAKGRPSAKIPSSESQRLLMRLTTPHLSFLQALQPRVLDRLIANISTLASVYHQAAVSTLKQR